MKIELTFPLTSDEIVVACGARYQGCRRIFTHIATSSYEADESTLFVALVGRHTSGEEFVASLCRKGICSLSSKVGEHIFTHPSPRDALLSLAKYYKTKLQSLKYTVAITGSVGKTTTKEFLLSLLSTHWQTHANEGNLNSEIGVPLTIFRTPPSCEVLILEFGMNHRGEIRKLAHCAEPDVAIITNIGHAHIGNLGSLEEIAMEKMDICHHNENIPTIIPQNEPHLDALKNKITLGETIKIDQENTGGVHNINLTYKRCSAHLSLPAFPKDTLACLTLALGAGLYLGLKENELQQGLELCKTYDARRKEFIFSKIKVIDDTYNASPESMNSGIEYLMGKKAKRRHAVVGDMLELGTHTEALHISLGQSLAIARPDFVYLFGEFSRYTEQGLLDNAYPKENIFRFDDVRHHEGLVRALANHLSAGDICWLKASHSVRLWRVIEGLREVFI